MHSKSSIISTVVLPTTEIVEPFFLCKCYTELDFLGHSVRMTVSADLAQLVEQRTRNA